jgi:hypothetical protein
MSLKAQSFAVSLLFSALITLSCFPVLAWHYWVTLAGFGVLSIGGLLMSDCVLWFAAYWSVRAESALVRVVALVTKFTIAAVAIGVAAVVVYAMSARSDATRAQEELTAANVAEVRARGEAVASVAKLDKLAAREFAKQTSQTSSPAPATAIDAAIPEWARSVWLVALLPLVSLLGALALSVAAGMSSDSSSSDVTDMTENFRQVPEATAIDAASLPVAVRRSLPAPAKVSSKGRATKK